MTQGTPGERLGSRLLTVAELLPECETFFDIGTDHGKLPAHLLATGKCRRAVLCDISGNSLNKARRLFDRLGLAGTFVETDGLTGLTPGPGDALALCGMGAHGMLSILENGLPCPAALQPSSRADVLREGLARGGVRILRERLAREEGRFYVCLLTEPGAKVPLTERAAYLGSLREEPLYADYLTWQRSVLTKALSKGSPNARLRRRLAWIEEELCFLT